MGLKFMACYYLRRVFKSTMTTVRIIAVPVLEINMTGTSYVSEWVTLRGENNNFEPQYTHKVRYLWHIILGVPFKIPDDHHVTFIHVHA